MKKGLITKGVLAAQMVFICVGITSCGGNAPQAPQSGGYKVTQIELSDKALSSSYSASIKGRQDIEIRPQVSGLITEVNVKEGANVNKGQTLFIIDQVAYKAALETALANQEVANANVANAQITADSKKELYAQNVVSEFEMATAQNSLKSAMAALAQAKAQTVNARNNLSYTVVKSPSNGVVGTLPYKIGALVNPSITIPMTTISDNSQMYAYFSMTGNQVLDMARKSGSMEKAIENMPDVELMLNDKSIYEQHGRIETISGVIDPKTGTVSVRAAFDNPNRILLSGSVGNIILPYDMKDCIIIAQSATYEIQDQIYVYKVVDGKTVSTQIEVFAVNDGKQYIVQSGLQVGDKIIAEGAGLMREGVVVE